MFFDKLLDAFKIENLISATKTQTTDNHINEKYKKALSTINRLSDDPQNNSVKLPDFPIPNLLEDEHKQLGSNVIDIINSSTPSVPTAKSPEKVKTNLSSQRKVKKQKQPQVKINEPSVDNHKLKPSTAPDRHILEKPQKEPGSDVIDNIHSSTSLPAAKPPTETKPDLTPREKVEKQEQPQIPHNEPSMPDNPIVEQPYESERFFIPGLHLQFIEVVRDVIKQGKFVPVALKRKYHLSQDDLSRILSEAQTAHLLDPENKVLVSKEFYEKFVDQYNPKLFTCTHGAFDKELYMCIGEIAIESGAESLYDEFDSEDILDYLKILENTNVIQFSNTTNMYKPLISLDEFREKCKYIPSIQKTELKAYNLNELDSMNGYDFERACVHILKDNSFSNVRTTSKSKDHGIDVFACKEDISYAIQCKCYSSNVGNSAIQQAHTGKSLYHKDIAVIMTNQYFTKQAKEEAQALGVKLWDRDKLNAMICNTK